MASPFFCCAGKQAILAINALPQRSASLRHKPSVEPSLPLFLDNNEIECDWRPGDQVQCFDGFKVKRVTVEPYLLASGAAARGPLEVIKLMQRNAKRQDLLYFCLMAIAKFEFHENEDGRCTREAKACILQTLKIFGKHAGVPAIAAAALAALVQLAQNYAGRDVISKEEWCRLVVAALNNLTFEFQEVILRHADGNEKVQVRTATRQYVSSP
ncbi:hypothetical protein CTAYLR_003921 [Chrysophaeum taylorii]|uniref:Uncharacterized protein n=1 Tax=Chrysophaeum taylorii TaxID=2483200 RepID=A0AAD7U9F4_9STRA|nr:hypothetical protein CTAYLR_003921 [Chrysophaeum taylorii]